MNFKKAVLYGILNWILLFLGTTLLNPLFTSRLPHVNILVPTISIISTTIFGILYIRNYNSNEVIEGFLAGCIFILTSAILDFTILILPNTPNLIFREYPIHFFSTFVVTLFITTFLGYLAQMDINLK
ncbi:hypothetical protein [uncultured Methanobrevibacter sp.]|uniref:hypothetical protein n=1 Tax=uncultured Methanobrevibacter sp. TaxID=253161 RepID=UPI0025DC2583|nr:hypothetical protein [uncultured Methanobrevibacter sp.]